MKIRERMGERHIYIYIYIYTRETNVYIRQNEISGLGLGWGGVGGWGCHMLPFSPQPFMNTYDYSKDPGYRFCSSTVQSC